MKKSIIILLLSVFAVGFWYTTSVGTDTSTPFDAVTGKPAAKTSMIAPKPVVRPPKPQHDPVNELGLMPAQQVRYRAAILSYGQQRKQLLRSRKSITQQQYQTRLADIRQAHEHQLIDIMGLPLFRRMQNEKNERRKARDHHHGDHIQQHRLNRRMGAQ